jgi:hypothetical protein
MVNREPQTANRLEQALDLSKNVLDQAKSWATACQGGARHYVSKGVDDE